ncbi:HTTM domain-containing protein [Weeksella virosa]|uniref:HTTM domain protein n=1 Tax=Weeksella virosa (strain ATCC 43766 / DSM 16922 / JCM 21250 / CCUG 30538 / CDC 9751 / IAM 14551 / NBRC 16016 / NCTC 11634 / CL345/78) TaxID=865938 RepID=F0NY65_WEEVC|nr:HTTM domain-containing protein [Weeksella virosa]ADX67056.1 HTTM domain protein [Weeksella virosa DSM 16922]SUP53324.1 antimicrobial peptide system protein, SdpB family [Weeksella virosa]VEH63209.1 antimicrobial peptide system protein, SdpB family [Weeksella virosa]
MENRKTGILLLRVLIGLSILKDFFAFFHNKNFLFNNNGIVSYETYQDIMNYYKLDFLNVDFNNSFNVSVFCILGIIFSITFILGIFPRISALLLFFLLLIFKFRNIYLMDGGDNIITAVLPLFLFIKSESLIEGYNKLKERLGLNNNFYINQTHKLFVLGIMIQICIVYFFAGLHKLHGEVWLNGTALYFVLNSGDFSAYSINEYITRFPILVCFLTWFTIAFQLSFPFVVWILKTRKVVLLIGILLHIGIFLMMRIDNFSFIMLACYTIFFTDSEYEILKSKSKKFIRL